MKYFEKYPNAVNDDEPEPAIVFCASNRRACVTCRVPTGWWDFSFSLPVCSEECRTKLHRDFEKAWAKDVTRLEGNITDGQ